MSAQILPFDRAKVLHQALNLEEALRRVRMAARAAGCNVHQVEDVQRHAVRLWCHGALDAAFVIDRAREYARELVAATTAASESA
jgi:hypothetical protein